ncbi:uncharacterized protein LOC144378451 [Ictidomys tridecemlineatus]
MRSRGRLRGEPRPPRGRAFRGWAQGFGAHGPAPAARPVRWAPALGPALGPGEGRVWEPSPLGQRRALRVLRSSRRAAGLRPGEGQEERLPSDGFEDLGEAVTEGGERCEPSGPQDGLRAGVAALEREQHGPRRTGGVDRHTDPSRVAGPCPRADCSPSPGPGPAAGAGRTWAGVLPGGAWGRVSLGRRRRPGGRPGLGSGSRSGACGGRWLRSQRRRRVVAGQAVRRAGRNGRGGGEGASPPAPSSPATRVLQRAATGVPAEPHACEPGVPRHPPTPGAARSGWCGEGSASCSAERPGDGGSQLPVRVRSALKRLGTTPGPAEFGPALAWLAGPGATGNLGPKPSILLPTGWTAARQALAHGRLPSGGEMAPDVHTQPCAQFTQVFPESPAGSVSGTCCCAWRRSPSLNRWSACSETKRLLSGPCGRRWLPLSALANSKSASPQARKDPAGISTGSGVRSVEHFGKGWRLQVLNTCVPPRGPLLFGPH